MNMNPVTALLTDIRDAYIRIHQMTETMYSDPRGHGIERIVRTREQLLCGIQERQQKLDTGCAGWKAQCENDPALATVRSEIERLITAVLVLDTMIQSAMSEKIEEMKHEIGSLAQTSKAAISYARHAL